MTHPEHQFWFLHGSDANGKGIFLNSVHSILGDYAKIAPPDVFTLSKVGEHHPTSTAGLVGCRMAMASETENNARWSETKVKALVAGDPISTRFMRQDFFEFVPQFKLLISGNHKPRLSAVDEAVRRRINLLPFDGIVPPEKRDPKLKAKLRERPRVQDVLPLLSSLTRLLDAHRERDKGPVSGPIFRTGIGTPLDFNNVLHRMIRPALNRCATCKRAESDHTAKVAHKYQRDESLPQWRGWHAFRRGLGTNLYSLGVNEKTAQAILRHADVGTTMTYYVKPLAEDSVRAMAALDAILCSTCALDSAVTEGTKTQ